MFHQSTYIYLKTYKDLLQKHSKNTFIASEARRTRRAKILFAKAREFLYRHREKKIEYLENEAFLTYGVYEQKMFVFIP